MPRRWSDRWARNADGSYRRNIRSGSVIELDSMSKADLQAELELRGLPKSGNKEELAARLAEASKDDA